MTSIFQGLAFESFSIPPISSIYGALSECQAPCSALGDIWGIKGMAPVLVRLTALGERYFSTSGFHEESLPPTFLASCPTSNSSLHWHNDLPGWFDSSSPLCGAHLSKFLCRWKTGGSALFLRDLDLQKQSAGQVWMF